MSDLANQLATRAATPATQGSTVADLIEREAPKIAQALPLGMSIDRFKRIVFTELRKNPKLALCTQASFIGAVMVAAQLGLEPGNALGHCYLVPRKKGRVDEVNFQLGYRGIVDLALRGGRTRSIDAHVVYERDEFGYEYGTGRFLRHVPAGGDRGDPLLVWAMAELENGGKPFVVLNYAEVERRRARGGFNGVNDSPAWKNDWAAMARKTAIRALSPYLPQSTEFAHALRSDDAVVTDYTSALEDRAEPEPEDEYEDVEVVEPPEGDPFDPAIVVQARSEVAALTGKAKTKFFAWFKSEGLEGREWDEPIARSVIDWLHSPAEDAS